MLHQIKCQVLSQINLDLDLHELTIQLGKQPKDKQRFACSDFPELFIEHLF